MNNSRVVGTYQPADGGFALAGMAVDDRDGRLFVGDTEAGVLSIIDTRNNSGISQISTPERAHALAYDPQDNEVWMVGDPWNVSAINASTGAFLVANLRLPNGPNGVAYDSNQNRVFVISRYNAAVTEIDPANATTFSSQSLSTSPAAICFDPATDKIFISDYAGNVTVLNGATGKIAPGGWHVGGFPVAMAIDPLHDWIYIADANSGNVSVYNASTGLRVDAGIAVGNAPVGLAYLPSDRSILVSNGASPLVAEIYTSNNTVRTGGIRITCCGGDIAVDSQTGTAYVVEYSPGGYLVNYVAVIRPETSAQLVTSVQIAYAFYGSTFDPADGLVYVVNPTGANGTGNPAFPTLSGPKNGSLMALDPVSRKFTGGAYPVGYGATAVAYDGTNRDLYVTDQYGGNVSVISPASGAVATVVIGAQQGPIALAVNPVGNLVYVANYNGSSVSVIGGSTNRLVTSAPVGASPDALTYDPRSNLLYVANCGSNNVSVLNGTSLAPLKSIPVGECPSDLTIDATTNELLVANFYSPTGGYSNVTFVNLSSGLSDGSVATAFGAKALCIDPANGYLYVANAGSSNLTIVNLSSRSQAAPGIPVDQWPEQSYPTTITYDPIEQDLVIPTVFASAVYVVGDVPSLRALNVSPDPGEVGVATEIVVQGAGGTAPYSVQFSGLPPGCPGLDSFALLCTPLVSGNFTVTATLTDAHGFPVLGSAGFPVAPALTLIAVLAVPGEIDQGSSSVISGDVAGGVPPLSYSYAGLPPGCTSVDRPTLSCAPSVAGTYSVRLIVTDDLRVQAVGAVAIVVHPGLNVTLLSPNGGSAVVGQSVDFFATVSGGASPFLYSYSGLPPGCSAVNGPVAQCNLTTAGRWEPIVNVTDSTGRTGQGQGTLVVDPYVVAPEIAAFYADPSNFALGTSTTLFVVVTGTAGPWALEFSNLPLGCTSGNSTSLACTPRQIGTYTINVTLSSRGSVRASASTSMTVHPSPVSPAAGPPAWDWLYGVAIGATGAAVVGLMALGLVRRRRPRRPPEVSVPPEPLPP